MQRRLLESDGRALVLLQGHDGSVRVDTFDDELSFGDVVFPRCPGK